MLDRRQRHTAAATSPHSAAIDPGARPAVWNAAADVLPTAAVWQLPARLGRRSRCGSWRSTRSTTRSARSGGEATTTPTQNRASLSGATPAIPSRSSAPCGGAIASTSISCHRFRCADDYDACDSGRDAAVDPATHDSFRGCALSGGDCSSICDACNGSLGDRGGEYRGSIRRGHSPLLGGKTVAAL